MSGLAIVNLASGTAGVATGVAVGSPITFGAGLLLGSMCCFINPFLNKERIQVLAAKSQTGQGLIESSKIL